MVETTGDWQKPAAHSVAAVLVEPAPVSDADVQYVSQQIVQARAEVVASVVETRSLPLAVPASTRLRSAILAHRADDAHDMTAALEVAIHRLDELRNALPAAIEAAGPEHAPALRDLLNII